MPFHNLRHGFVPEDIARRAQGFNDATSGALFGRSEVMADLKQALKWMSRPYETCPSVADVPSVEGLGTS